MLLHELGQMVFSPVSIVLDRLRLLATRSKENCRKAFNGKGSWRIVGSRVELGQNEIGLALLELGCHLLVLGFELFAVSAPRSIELDQNVLGLVVDDLVEVGSDESLDWSLIVLWHRLRLDEWLNFSYKRLD